MTTATTQRPTARAVEQPHATGPRSASTDIDFDTRLMATHILMDVLLGDDEAVQEARQTAADAIAAAARYSAESAALTAVLAPPETFTSHPILKRAGDIVRDRGWHQGDWTSQQGAVCALAAVRLACGGRPEREAEAVAVLLTRIRHEFGDGASSVPGWNDRRDRTRADVLRLLW
jgi:hypothetical protein